MLSAYRNGNSPASICRQFELSERNYGSILLKYRVEFAEARECRKMNQKRSRDKLKSSHAGDKVSPRPSKKITPEDKIEHLESQLDHERNKNKELEELLRIAKEQLGKS